MSTSNHPRADRADIDRPPGARESLERPQASTTLAADSCGVCVVDSEMCLWALDARAGTILGGSEPLPGQNFADLIRYVWPAPLAASAIERIRRALTNDRHRLPRVAPAARIGSGRSSADDEIRPVTLPGGRRGAVVYVYPLSRGQQQEAAGVAPTDTAAAGEVPESIAAYDRFRDSRARLQLALEASGMGTFVWYVNEDRADPDRRLLSLFGLAPNGTPAFREAVRSMLHPEDRQRFADAVRRACDPAGSGLVQEEIRVRHEDGERWLAITARTVFEPIIVDGAASRRALRLSGIGSDITERKRREANVAVLAALADDFAQLSSAADIERVVGERIALHLELSSVYLLEIDEPRGEVRLRRLWGAEDLPDAARLPELLSDEVRAALESGDSVVVRDTATDLRTASTPYAALAIRAFVNVPFIRGGHLTSAFAVAARQPRHWREDEVSLCRELSARLLPRLERARAEHTVASDLRDTRLLMDLSVRLVSEADTEAFFDAIVAAAMAITGADAGCMHLVDAGANELVLLTTTGFDQEATRILSRVDAGSPCSSGRALATGRRVFVDFVDPDAPASDGLRRSPAFDFASAQSTPLVTRAGHLIGTLSTYWRTHRRLSDRELRFLDLLARQAADMIERRRTDDTLRERERQLSAELADTKLLQRLSAHLIEGADGTAIYQTIVDAATSIMRSQFASMQVFYPERGARGELRLLAARGFDAEAERFWEWVTPDSPSTCGVALRDGGRVVVPDVAACDVLDPRTLLAGGVRAAQSTPLVSRGGHLVGMISTHWSEPHQPSERDLRLLDILARQAADVMERAQAQDALRRSESQLREADRRKDEFLAMLAHELRNPLAPLRTSLELIRLAGNTPDAVESVRTMMEDQVRHMVRLIDDLLDVSRITLGKIRLQRQPTPLATLVKAATEAHRDAFAAKRLSLDIGLPDETVLLDVDPTRLVQVLSNIIHNAVKFSDTGGHVAISAVLTAAPGSLRDLTLTVRDSGAGISRDMLPRMFDLFTQDERVPEGAENGLGIGLALAKRLIGMHGGSIEGQSDGPGLGSTFTIWLPESAAPTAPRSAAPAAATVRVSRRVVVIDDNVQGANAMRRLVKALGGDCRVAHDGEAGVEQVLAFQPDVVFVDIGMPGIDGYETCRRIRERVGAGVIVVALTGWGRVRDKQAAALAGFDVHLTKPADPAALELLLTDPDPRGRLAARPLEAR